MTEQIQDQMSAFVDDELSAEQCAFLVRRLEHDPAARGKLIRYTTIGCALRGELLQPDPGILRRRLHEALDGTAPAVQRKPAAASGGWRTRVGRPALGAGIAASVAIVGVLALRMSALGPDALEASSSSGPSTAGWVEPSYVVPQSGGDQRAVAAPIRLTNYLMHHGEYASRLSRTSVDSNVVGARELPPESFRTISEDSEDDAGNAAE